MTTKQYTKLFNAAPPHLIVFSLILIFNLVPHLVLGQDENKPHVSESKNSLRIFQIDNFEVIPNKKLELIQPCNLHKDTLNLVTCSDFIYFPFGNLKSKNDLKSSPLRNFTTQQITEDLQELQLLKLNKSRLILFFDTDTESSMTSYITKGEIYDKAIKLVNGIKIGMSRNEFFKILFDKFPIKKEQSIREVVMETCVDGLKHHYTFQKNKLISIRFECIQCTWKTDY